MLSTKTIYVNFELWALFGGHWLLAPDCHVAVQSKKRARQKKSYKLGVDEFGPPAQCRPVFFEILCRILSFNT